MREHSDRSSGATLWAIVLAGGEGVRLRPLVREMCGDERPKQFAKIVGSKSLLRHTLDRVGLKILPRQTVIVTCRAHEKYMAQEPTDGYGHRVLVQPEDRGTAAGVLFPAHWINSQDPNAIVAIFPSDHYIIEASLFMSHIVSLAGFVLQQPDRLVLVGAPADTPETEYGWIEPGETLGRIGSVPVLQVKRFWEKPSEPQARVCLAGGCLWNTLVIVAKLSTLLDAGQRLLPELTTRVARAASRVAVDGGLDIDHDYSLAPKADFSRMILQASPPLLAVSTPSELTWSDLGTPPRVRQTLRMVASSGALREGAVVG